MSNAHTLWNRIAGGGLYAPQLAKIDRYLDLLIEKNQHLNLTRISDRADAEVKHVADALTLLPLIPRDTRSLADVGTGGGIPGVILAIARPDLAVTLIDATRKKLDAVTEMCAAAGIENVKTIHARAETVEQRFDIVTARAVADMETLANWCIGLMGKKSMLLALKGPRAAEELAAAAKNLRRLRLRAESIDPEVPELPGHVVVRVWRAEK